MSVTFVPHKTFDAAIAGEALGHVFSTVIEPWLGRAGALDYLRICILSPGKENGCIIGKLSDYMISFTNIRPKEVQGIRKIIISVITAALRRNQSYWRLNHIK